ncbi:hypothetical protein C8J57DRAFT_1465813 [Mycena rebaudengoi]|nr:hypothetical protein C8J57DRAFT_1479899 [Mycena rebaudengoi]KAJ7278065.1 hypothetical protein C8J57DRAFT_1465813 [Mycena rebaudengoi]
MECSDTKMSSSHIQSQRAPTNLAFLIQVPPNRAPIKTMVHLAEMETNTETPNQRLIQRSTSCLRLRRWNPFSSSRGAKPTNRIHGLEYLIVILPLAPPSALMVLVTSSATSSA